MRPTKRFLYGVAENVLLVLVWTFVSSGQIDHSFGGLALTVTYAIIIEVVMVGLRAAWRVVFKEKAR